MKKLFLFTMTAALMTGSSLLANGTGAPPVYTPPAPSQDYVVGGFEASGSIFAGGGWQRFKASTVNAPVAVTRDINGTIPGVIGHYVDTNGRVTRINREDAAVFFVDSVELDLAKTFGENIRVRADLDFGGADMYSGPLYANLGVGLYVEQAYATANLAIGNGLELLLGRFNAPMGFESVDVVANDTISRSIIFRALRPHTFTGLKFYYPFSDFFDWQVYAANNGLALDDGDVLEANTDIPLVGTRFGFHWGEEGKMSYLGLNGAGGQDHANLKNAWSFLGDLDWNWWATDNFAVGGEAIYRQVDTTTARGRNGKYLGGLLNLHYDFSDVWDGTLKYAYAHDINGPTNAGVLVTSIRGVAQTLTGLAAGAVSGQQYHEGALAGQYTISEGAKLKLEGSYALILPAGRGNRQHVFGAAGGFAYEF